MGDGDSILEAAIDSGLEMSHDCKMGVCMTCPARLVRGRCPHGVSPTHRVGHR